MDDKEFLDKESSRETETVKKKKRRRMGIPELETTIIEMEIQGLNELNSRLKIA